MTEEGQTFPAATDTAAPAVRPDERARINLSWLLRLRWGAAVGQIATILVARSWLGVDLRLAPLFALVGGELVTNAACAAWRSHARRIPESLIGAIMALDVLLLTGLFHFSGGSSNPFTSLYLVNIALAAVVLSPAWTWSLVGLSLACFAALFLQPLEGGVASHAAHGPQNGGELWLHLEGMWIAFGVGAGFIVYFVQRVTRALAERDRELAGARAATLRAERLASLATLAAGAAHELSTPLSTIAVVARELERQLTSLRVGEAQTADARLIREQVERCREILVQMAADAGESTGEDFTGMAVEALLDAATRDLAEGSRLRVVVAGSAAGHELVLPPRATAQALRAVVKNALQASTAEVEVSANLDGDTCRIEVRDRGAGMAPEVLARAFEPFFTTKETGRGMGLGLFLARDVVERIGGGLDLLSERGRGTTAVLRLPAGTGRELPRWPVPARVAA